MLSVVTETFVLSIFEWPFYTGFTIKISRVVPNIVYSKSFLTSDAIKK